MTETQTEEMQDHIADVGIAAAALHALGRAALAERLASRAVAVATSAEESVTRWKQYCDAAVKLRIAVAQYAECCGVQARLSSSSISPTPSPPAPLPAQRS